MKRDWKERQQEYKTYVNKQKPVNQRRSPGESTFNAVVERLIEWAIPMVAVAVVISFMVFRTCMNRG